MSTKNVDLVPILDEEWSSFFGFHHQRVLRQSSSVVIGNVDTPYYLLEIAPALRVHWSCRHPREWPMVTPTSPLQYSGKALIRTCPNSYYCVGPHHQLQNLSMRKKGNWSHIKDKHQRPTPTTYKSWPLSSLRVHIHYSLKSLSILIYCANLSIGGAKTNYPVSS